MTVIQGSCIERKVGHWQESVDTNWWWPIQIKNGNYH